MTGAGVEQDLKKVQTDLPADANTVVLTQTNDYHAQLEAGKPNNMTLYPLGNTDVGWLRVSKEAYENMGSPGRFEVSVIIRPAENRK